MEFHQVNFFKIFSLVLTTVIGINSAAWGFQTNEGINLLSPNGGERFFTSKSIQFRWKNNSTSNRVLIYMNDNQIADTENDGQFEWQIPSDFPLGSYKAKILSLEGEEDETNTNLVIMTECQIEATSVAISYELNEENIYIGLQPKYAKRRFHNTNGNWLHFKYRERYRKEISSDDKIIASIYDWRKNKLATVELNRRFGINHYSLDLTKICNNIPKGKEYFVMEIADENGSLYSFSFRHTDKASIESAILMNPILFNCGVENGNEIEYMGNIDGGTAPFTVTWHISNTQNKNDAYRSEGGNDLIPKGEIPSITVYDKPGYYVIMEVRDSCGKMSEQIAYISCQENQGQNQVTIQIVGNTINSDE